MPIQMIVPSIIQAYMSGENLRRRDEQRRADEKFRQEVQQEKIHQFDANMKQQQTAFRAQQEYRNKQQELAVLGARGQMMQLLAQGTLPGTEDEQGGVYYDDPVLGRVTAASADTQLSRKRKEVSAATDAKVEEQTKIFEALNPLREANADTASRRRIEEAKIIGDIRSKSDKELIQLRNQGQLDVAKLRGAFGRQNILLRKSLGETSEDTALQNRIVDQAYQGLYSIEDMSKIEPNAKERSRISRQVAARGGKILTKGEIQDLKNLQAFRQLVNLNDEANALIKQYGKRAFAMSNVNEALQILKTRRAEFAKTIGGEGGGRFSDKDLAAQEPNFVTTNLYYMSENDTKAKRLHNFMFEKLKSITTNITDENQLNTILDRFELLQDQSAQGER